MKRILLIALVTIAASCAAWAQEKTAKPAPPKKAAGSIQEEIKKLEEDRNQAILKPGVDRPPSALTAMRPEMVSSLRRALAH